MNPSRVFIERPVATTLLTIAVAIAGAIAFAEKNALPALESSPEAEKAWAAEVERAGSATIMASGVDANAWFIGANIPGKPIEFNVYMGGADEYFRRCDAVAAQMYASFVPVQDGS